MSNHVRGMKPASSAVFHNGTRRRKIVRPAPWIITVRASRRKASATFASTGGRPLFPRYAGPFEIAAEYEVQVHPLAQSGGADLGQLDFCGEIFPGKPQDREHVDLALFELLPAEFHGVGTARNRVGQRAFAFAQVVIACESVFHVFERSQRGTHVACRGGFLLGGAKILRSLKFTAEENRLRNPGSQTPDDGIERADRVELRGSESTRGAKHKARQARGASLVHPMKGCCETALTGDEVWPAFENLRGQTGRHAFWLSGEGTSHLKSADGVAARDDLDRADRLRPCRLRGVECILRGGGARLDLRHIKVAREPLLFPHVGELRVLLVEIESFLRVGFLLRCLDGREIRARHGGGKRLPGKFVVGFQRAAFSLRGSFFRANAAPYICLPCGAGGDAIHPALRCFIRARVEASAAAVLRSRAPEVRRVDVATDVAAKSLPLALAQSLHRDPWVER